MTASKSKKSAEKQDDNHSERQAKGQLDSIRKMVATLAKFGDEEGMEYEEALDAIQNDPLSVEVRSDWYTLDAKPSDERRKPAEFCILLCTGGPACRIIGKVNEHGEPESPRIEHQDWGTPWTEYPIDSADDDVLLAYCRQFYFGD